MPECSVCQQPPVAYLQVFRRKKKVGAFPVCVYHASWAYGVQEFAQDWARSGIAQAFGIRKGSIPRLKVSLTP